MTDNTPRVGDMSTGGSDNDFNTFISQMLGPCGPPTVEDDDEPILPPERERLRIAGAPQALWQDFEAPDPPINLPITGEGAKSYEIPKVGDDEAITRYRTDLKEYLGERSRVTSEWLEKYELDHVVKVERRRDTARRIVQREKADEEFERPPYNVGLAAELAEEIAPLTPRIDRLSYCDQNVLVSAKAKSGKTTLSVHLVKCFADGAPFLGALKVTPPVGNIGYLNYEMSRAQFNSWLREANIQNLDRVSVLHLRDYRLPLLSATAQDFIVEWATECGLEVIIADPWGRMISGSASENSNDDVREVLKALDEIKRKAAVRDLFVIAHMGHAAGRDGGEERARGASALLGWPDALWTLTVQEGTRYLSAIGRDIEFVEQALAFDATTRRLSLPETGGDRVTMRNHARIEEVVSIVAREPGVKTSAIYDAMASTTNREQKVQALKEAARRGLVHSFPGPNNSKLWHMGPGEGPSFTSEDGALDLAALAVRSMNQ